MSDSDIAGAAAPRELPQGMGMSVRSGVFWTVFGQGSSQIIRFFSNLVLTRLLAREYFGLMQLTTTFLVGIALFSDVGLVPALIQNPRAEDRTFRNTAWTLHAVRGVVLCLITAIGAIPFANFYSDSRLKWVLIVCGTTPLINGFVSMKLFLTRRRMMFRELSLLQFASQFIASLVCIGIAFVYPSVWALVVSSIVSTVVTVLGSYFILKGQNDWFAWDKDVLREIIRFGRWIFLSTILSFCVGQSDRLVFGKLIPLATLGVYGIAANMARLPGDAFGEVIQQVLFPAWSRTNASGDALGPVYNRLRAPFVVLGAWIVSGMLAGGQVIFDILYDRRYTEGGWMLRILVMGVWFQILESPCSAVLLALGQSRWLTISNAMKFVAMLTLISVGHLLYGFPGALAGFAATSIPSYAAFAYAVQRRGISTVYRDAAMTLWILLSAGVATVLLHLTSTQITNNWARAFVVLLVVSALWAPFGWPHVRRLPVFKRRSGNYA